MLLKKGLAEAERHLLVLSSLERFLVALILDAERKGFRRLLRAYLSLYLSDYPFEISRTNLYTKNSNEADITSRVPTNKRAEIKYLCGIPAILTALIGGALNSVSWKRLETKPPLTYLNKPVFRIMTAMQTLD
jgi:hypothetical protein